jgi:stringent starvation protein B
MAEPTTSTKPYLLRALYEWCVDNGFTPYVSVMVDARTRVPMEYVRDGEIVLNIGPLAASRLVIGNEIIECNARFSGIARELSIPVNAVAAIYARENGQGMSFEPERATAAPSEADGNSIAREHPPEQPDPVRPSGKPTLRRIK